MEKQTFKHYLLNEDVSNIINFLATYSSLGSHLLASALIVGIMKGGMRLIERMARPGSRLRTKHTIRFYAKELADKSNNLDEKDKEEIKHMVRKLEYYLSLQRFSDALVTMENINKVLYKNKLEA